MIVGPAFAVADVELHVLIRDVPGHGHEHSDHGNEGENLRKTVDHGRPMRRALDGDEGRSLVAAPGDDRLVVGAFEAGV